MMDSGTSGTSSISGTFLTFTTAANDGAKTSFAPNQNKVDERIARESVDDYSSQSAQSANERRLVLTLSALDSVRKFLF